MRRPVWLILCPLAIVVAGMPSAASATTLTAANILSQYNLVAASNVSSNDDIEGAAVIGGNLSGSPTFFNNNVPANKDVYLYGAVSNNTNVNVNNGGTFDYGSLGSGVNINLNGSGGSKQQGGWPNQITDYLTPLNQLSTQLSQQLQQSGNTTSIANNTLTFIADSADASGIAYFDLTTVGLEALLNSASNMQISLGSGVTSIVVNVNGAGAGNSLSFTSSSALHVPDALQDVLFNFYNDTSVTLNSWETSVLAPDAATTINNAFEGSLYTSTLQANGELHDLVYTGNLPPLPSNGPLPVPEPASLSLVAAGLIAIGALRRLRRAG